MYSVVIELLPFVFSPATGSGASGTNSLPRPGPMFDADEDCRATAAKVFNPWNGTSRVKGSDTGSGSAPGASSAGDVLPVGDAAFAPGTWSAGQVSPVRPPGMPSLAGDPGVGDSSASWVSEAVRGVAEARANFLAGDTGTGLAGDVSPAGDAGTGLAGDAGVGAGLVDAASCGLLMPGGVAWAKDAGAGVIAILFCLDVLMVRQLVK